MQISAAVFDPAPFIQGGSGLPYPTAALSDSVLVQLRRRSGILLGLRMLRVVQGLRQRRRFLRQSVLRSRDGYPGLLEEITVAGNLLADDQRKVELVEAFRVPIWTQVRQGGFQF